MQWVAMLPVKRHGAPFHGVPCGTSHGEEERMTGTVRRGLALIAIGSLLVSCSSSGPTSGPISATEKEWQISLSSTNLKAGAITFNVTNNGDKEHEFVIRKTDLQSDKLVLNADGEVSEDDPSLTPVGEPSELAEIKAGSSDRTITVTLTAGHYVVFCNLHVEDLLHYQKGMHVDFTVT
jgi:uncharacterized cupredoxin-like copper-binding protein